MRGSLRHVPCVARGAHATAIARKGNQKIVPALPAAALARATSKARSGERSRLTQPCVATFRRIWSSGNSTLAIDQSSDVGGVYDTQRMHHGSIRKKSPAGEPAGLGVGGGGGTVDPPLSRRAGLCLHPVARMRGVLSTAVLPVDPSIRPPASLPVGGSMSLYRARLGLAPFVPLGVAIPSCEGCRVRRCEPRVHSALTGRGDRC